MNAYDPNLHELPRGFDAIEARLEQHQRTTRIILIIVSILAALALILIVNYIPACATMAERHLSSIP
jgi:cell division protein FtsX